MKKLVFQEKAEKLNTERKKKKSWQKAVTAMAAVVVFCTTYALIIPAITWERSLICEKEEHTHTDACYETVTVPGNLELSCGMAEHTHSDVCYETVKELVCTDTEHEHTDDCYVTKKKLRCSAPEHTHTDECYTGVPAHEEQKLVCELEEHVHSDACFDAPPAVDEGYYCGSIAHKHNEYCYFADGSLRCTIPEHEHTAECRINKDADLEKQDQWVLVFDGIFKDTIDPRMDTLAVANTQLGYRESLVNFTIDENGNELPYTRYGEWYGAPYGDWNATFAGFCLYYGGAEWLPLMKDSTEWMAGLAQVELLEDAPEHEPALGEIAFFTYNKDICAGIVSQVFKGAGAEADAVELIVGDMGGFVAKKTVDAGDILSYMIPVENRDAAKIRKNVAQIIGEASTAELNEADAEMLTATAASDTEEPVTAVPGGRILLGAVNEPVYWTKVISITDPSANYMIVSNQGYAFGVRESGGSYSADAAAVSFTAVQDYSGYYTSDLDDTAFQWKFSAAGGDSKQTNVKYSGYGLRLSNDTIISTAGNETTNTVSTQSAQNMTCRISYTTGYYPIYYTTYYLSGGTSFSRTESTTSTSRNLTIYMQTELPKPEVTFKPNYTTWAPDDVQVSVEKGATLQKSDIPDWTRTSYALQGWSTSTSGGTVLTTAQLLQQPITGDVTYYARWTNYNNVTLTLNRNYGTTTTQAYRLVSGRSLNDMAQSLPNWTRTDYRLAGWSTSATGGTVISSEELLNKAITSTSTYYARWEMGECTVEFTSDGEATVTVSVPGGSSLSDIAGFSLPAWTRDNYTLIGWLPNGGTRIMDGTEVLSARVNADVTYAAQWRKNNLTVTLKGSGLTEREEFTVPLGKTLRDVEEFEWPEWAADTATKVFIGWSSDGGMTKLSNEILLRKVIDDDVTYTAQFENKVFHTVTLDPGIAAEHSSETYQVQKNYRLNDTEGFLLPVWAHSGYRRAGWKIQDDPNEIVYSDQAMINASITKNTVFIAQWELTDLRTVVLDPDFEGKYSKITHVVKVNYELKDIPGFIVPRWTKEDEVFIGWSCDGGITIISSEDLPFTPITADVVYKAQWVPAIKISFDLGREAEHIEAIDPMDVAGGTVIQPSDLPVPMWKTDNPRPFKGWYFDEELEQRFAARAILTDTTLYASFGEQDEAYYIYYCDFRRENDTANDVRVLKTLTVGAGISVPPYNIETLAPEKTAWDGKWYLDENLTIPYDGTAAVSDLTEYLVGEGHRDLYLWPGTSKICRVVFVTNGNRISPVEVTEGSVFNLDSVIATKNGFAFEGWYSEPEFINRVTGEQTITEDTTYYADWSPGYVGFTPVLQTENAENYNYTSAKTLADHNKWYALAGARVYVETSTQPGGGITHKVWCDFEGQRSPVYSNMPQRTEDGKWSGIQATLADVFDDYYIFADAGTPEWTAFLREAGKSSTEVPYGTNNILPDGSSIVPFTYIRVRVDITFNIYNAKRTGVSRSGDGGYMDMYTLHQNGVLGGRFDTGAAPAGAGNYSCSGTFANGKKWTYTAATSSTGTNVFKLLNVKYNELFPDHWPTKAWVTSRSTGTGSTRKEFNGWAPDDSSKSLWSSKRINMTEDMYKTGTIGRNAEAELVWSSFATGGHPTALLYALEALPGETPDFTIDGVGYKVDDRYTGYVDDNSAQWNIKQIAGCDAGFHAFDSASQYISQRKIDEATVNVMLAERAGSKFWPANYTTVSDFTGNSGHVHVFYYNRKLISVQFHFRYDTSGAEDPSYIEVYDDLLFGQNISEYRYAMPDGSSHRMLKRPNWRFTGWVDQYGVPYTAEDWDTMTVFAPNSVPIMTFLADWEPTEGSLIEFYETEASKDPFYTKLFLDGDYVPAPTTYSPDNGWKWTNSDTGLTGSYTGDFPLYGEYGVPEEIEGELIYVVKVYGSWNEATVEVKYDANEAQGGYQEYAPVDERLYTIGGVKVSVMRLTQEDNSQGKLFAGWKLEQNGTVYQPGNHVDVLWHKLNFVAQWVTEEESAKLRYCYIDSAGEEHYFPETPYRFPLGAEANVWDNMLNDEWYFTKDHYDFAGWNTEPDGSGISYAPDSTITLDSNEVVTLYAQWVSRDCKLKIIEDATDDVTAFDYRVTLNDGSKFDPSISTEKFHVDEDGAIVFSLKSGESVTLPIPYNAGVTITESGTDGYYTKYTDENGLNIVGTAADIGAVVENRNITVHNTAGKTLPATGGIGVIPLYTSGVLLIAGALMLEYRLRRKEREQTA